ncbi:hypothetical protein PTKIN_Ptkin11bG0054300 [Pterospermum kingtungense]
MVLVKSAGQEDDNLRLCASDPEDSKDHSPAGLSISNQLDGKFEEKLPTTSPPKERARRARTQMPMPKPMRQPFFFFLIHIKLGRGDETGGVRTPILANPDRFLKKEKFKAKAFDLRGGGGAGGGGGGTGQGVDQGWSERCIS